jgi:alanine racemase
VVSQSSSQNRAWAEVHLGALRSNIKALRVCLGANRRLMAVLKADAYGHGLLPIAQAAVEAGADWLGVATVAEGVALREAGLTAPIALLCPPAPLRAEMEALIAFQLTALLGDRETLAALAQAKGDRAPEVHLEIDTGIGRSGVLPDQAVALWREALTAGMRVTGLAMHFAAAENATRRETALTEGQLRRFARTYQALTEAGAEFALVHLCNSPGALRPPAFSCDNLVRPGLLLYGIQSQDLKAPFTPGIAPVLTLKARVATVRALPAGHPISYGATHRLTRPSRVATVLIGYGDGYPRRLSNRGAMLVRGQRAPILGRVCMDQTVVDVTDIPDAAPGDIAVCIGARGEERISVEEIAALIKATPHEITTGLTPRVRRLYQP